MSNLDENNSNPSKEMRVVKIAITEDLFRKIKSFGVLIGDDKNEAVLLGNAINELYNLSKEQISKNYM